MAKKPPIEEENENSRTNVTVRVQPAVRDFFAVLGGLHSMAASTFMERILTDYASRPYDGKPLEFISATTVQIRENIEQIKNYRKEKEKEKKQPAETNS